MIIYHLLSRFAREEMDMAIERPDSFVYQYGLALRFMRGDSCTFETKMKVEARLRLSDGVHGLLGRGNGQFVDYWLFIPGAPEIPCNLSTVLIAVPFKTDQPFKQLKLELEAATIKALEPTAPA
jgi:hypothetical protein